MLFSKRHSILFGMQQDDYRHELQVATELARKAGDVMLAYFDVDQQRQIKHDGTPITIADTKINALAMKTLTKAFPDYGMVGEEGNTADISQDKLWFCDPIDGTKAYTWGVPTAMFSLGLIVGNEPMLGVAYDPFLKRLYTGIRGQGSFCNGIRLKVSDEDLTTGIVAITSSVREIATNTPELIRGLIAANVQMASFSGGIYKGTLVACGKVVAYTQAWSFPHDVAALHTIVTEAGGKVSAVDGGLLDYRKGFRGALISNGKVHEQIVTMARK